MYILKKNIHREKSYSSFISSKVSTFSKRNVEVYTNSATWPLFRFLLLVKKVIEYLVVKRSVYKDTN